MPGPPISGGRSASGHPSPTCHFSCFDHFDPCFDQPLFADSGCILPIATRRYLQERLRAGQQ
jgi:hypothetical protein